MIVVISAIACFLGRLCSKKSQNQHHSGGGGQKPVKQQKQVHSVRPKDVGNGDLELGFDKRMPPAKPNGHGHGHGPSSHVHVPNGHGQGPGRYGRGNDHGYGHGHGGGRGPKPHAANDGDMTHKGFEMKLGKDGELRSGV